MSGTSNHSAATGTRVGLVGLGIMGSAMAKHLLAAGFAVTGYDIVDEKLDRFAAAGGHAATSPADVASRSDVVLTSLATPAAVHQVVGGDEGLVAGAHDDLIVVDTNTMPLETKEAARSRLGEVGVVLLDCTLSGTGAQAARRDLAVYGSGDRDAFERARPILEAVSRSVRYVGPFGAGSKMKFVANLLVAIHNVAAAEAFVLGRLAGLDPQVVYDVISDGAGTSRMFEVRGPMMVAGRYDDPSARMALFLKDVDVIDGFGRALGAPLPMFSATLPLYAAAMSQGRADQDPAAVHAVLETLAGHVARQGGEGDTPPPSGS